MNEYKTKIRFRLVALVICAVFAGAVVLLCMLSAGKAEQDNSGFMVGLAKGFPIGLFIGFYAVMLFNIVRCIRALVKEDVLKKLYVSEHDERKLAIRQNAMGKNFFFTTGALAVAVTVASFYSEIVTITLAVTLAVHVFSGVILKFYYSIKY